MHDTEGHYRAQREAMIQEQMRARNIHDDRVLAALLQVPRHEFVPIEARIHAYDDSPLPIGDRQTISQPYMVAYMTQLLKLTGDETILEIGTGSGYQTAILCELAQQVYSLERFPRLARNAQDTLDRLGYQNVEIYVGDGSQGLPDMAPFDAIIVTAVAPSVPGPLRSQLSPDSGRMVIPVGSGERQYLAYVSRQGDRCKIRRAGAVRFVPLIGRYGFSTTNK
jgi:protein-L-isoaspartate(D-aspartate) O-methyltransferase